MALSVHEALNEIGRPTRLEVGPIVRWAEIETLESRQALADHLYTLVQLLAGTR
jgi:hypothetical protein